MYCKGRLVQFSRNISVFLSAKKSNNYLLAFLDSFPTVWSLRGLADDDVHCVDDSPVSDVCIGPSFLPRRRSHYQTCDVGSEVARCSGLGTSCALLPQESSRTVICKCRALLNRRAIFNSTVHGALSCGSVGPVRIALNLHVTPL